MTCFFVMIYNAIDQGYMGLSLASCQNYEMWELRAELGLIWDHFRALIPIGTKSQIWDLITIIVLVIWIFSFLRPNFLKPKPRLFSETKFFSNQNRDFFSETKFPKTETDTFFRDQFFSKPKPRLFFRNQIFQNPKPKPSKNWQKFETEKFRNRNVNLCIICVLPETELGVSRTAPKS